MAGLGKVLGYPAGKDPAWQLLAILLWVHNGLGYIYGSTGIDRLTPAGKGHAAGGQSPRGSKYEHRAIY
jgi:hypothetical protein